MSSVLHLLLLLCPVYVGASLRNSRYRQYSGNNPGVKSWKGARGFCRNKNTDLVSITNRSDNVFIIDHFGWIGLYRNNPNSPWKWSLGDETANFTIWSDNLNNDNCAYKHSTIFGWTTGLCEATRSFICYRDTLILVKESKTWEDALEHCRSLRVQDPTAYNNHRYDLATLLSLDDVNFAREIMHGATTDMVWTGLRFLAGRWIWSSGEDLQYTMGRCEDNEACGGLDKNLSDPYIRSNCERKLNFLCSWKT